MTSNGPDRRTRVTRQGDTTGAADERIEVAGRPPVSELGAWQAWFRHHGIDPTYVPTSNSIERRPAARQVVCDMYDLHEDEHGGRFTTGRIVKQQVFQLDEPPLPFP